MKNQKIVKKKRKIIIILIVLIIFFPITGGGNEGELESIKAILYSYRTYILVGKDGSYSTRSEFLIFPFNILN